MPQNAGASQKQNPLEEIISFHLFQGSVRQSPEEAGSGLESLSQDGIPGRVPGAYLSYALLRVLRRWGETLRHCGRLVSTHVSVLYFLRIVSSQGSSGVHYSSKRGSQKSQD